MISVFYDVIFFSRLTPARLYLRAQQVCWKYPNREDDGPESTAETLQVCERIDSNNRKVTFY